jgi:ComF family protein
MYKLPKTNFHTQADNPLAKVFYGRAELNAAAAYCHFQTGNMVQTLVHELKYKGKKELGTHLGKWYGHELKESPLYNMVEVVLPVPLHKRKLKKRGYNQSAYFANGLAQSMGVHFMEDGLTRVKDTETQTNKSRYERWENVKDIFQVNRKAELAGKHVLLVDDIITTGATVESCVHTLANAQVASVSVASIGYANII